MYQEICKRKSNFEKREYLKGYSDTHEMFMRTKLLPLAKSIFQQSERAVIFLSNPPYSSNPPGGFPRQINNNLVKFHN